MHHPSWRFGKKTLQSKVLPAVIVLAVAGIGVYFLVGSHAATPYASVNADSGTLAGGAVSFADSTASNHNKVEFNGTSATQTTNCFPSPGACGFPDPNFAWNSASAWASGGGGVGPNNGTTATPCSSLPSSGAVTASTAGQTVQNLNISGGLDIAANNVTVKNVCVSVDGGDNYDSGGPAISVEGTNDTIEDSSFGGANDTTQATQQAIANSNPVTLSHDYLHSCSECIHAGLTINDSSVITTSAIVTGDYGTDHYEDWYFSGGTISANHDTMLNAMDETAVIFGDSSGSCDNHVTITDDLMAGGDYTLQPCANASSVGSSTMNVSDNRFARCISSKCPDSHGYYPNGGYYNADAYTYCSGNNQTWSNNVWDDNNATVGC